MVPKWLTPISALALLVGGALVIGGPMLLYAYAAVRVDVVLTPEQLTDPELCEQTLAQQLKIVRERFAWIIPLGCGLAFSGGIGLLLAWVSRPLGDDLEKQPPE